LGYAFPPAVVAGHETPVSLGGFDFTTDMQWFVHDPSARLEPLGPPGDYQLPPPPYWFGPRASTPALPIPREVPARIMTDPAGPERLVRWQVANANGSSATAMFYVSRGREIVEARSRDFPQQLPEVPVAVSGRLSRLTETDRYEWVADADGLVCVELFARRLGSDFHAVLEARDQSGMLLAELADTAGRDGLLAFAARAGQKYQISLHDADYRGDRAYVYRLALARGPRVVCTMPAFGKRGATHDLIFVGHGLASGLPRLETTRQSVTFPADAAGATHLVRLATPAGHAEVSIPLSSLDQHVRPAEAAETHTVPLAAPCAVTGRFPPGHEIHGYTWMSQPGEYWSIGLESAGIGGRLDMALAVLDPGGNLVGESDDMPGTSDASVEFRAAAAGQYTCLVRSLGEVQGSADEIYCLRINRPEAGFALFAPQQVNLPLAGKVEVPVRAARQGGFEGQIDLSVEGLPPGIALAEQAAIPPGKSEAKLVVQSSADAAVVASLLTIRGTAMIEQRPVTREALAPAGGNLCPRTPAESHVARVLLAMTMPAPFEVRVVDRERQRDVPRGTTYRAELEIVRQQGFEGEILLEMSAQQDRYRQGTTGPVVRVPPGATRAFYPCFLPEWLPTDLTRRIVVHGVAGVPDPRGNVRQLTRAGDARITMIMEGALLKVTSPAGPRVCRLGETFDVPVVVSRAARLPLPVTVSLELPEEAAGLLSAAPVVLPPGVDQGTLRASARADQRLAGPWQLRIRATALEEGVWPVVSEAELEVEFEAP